MSTPLALILIWHGPDLWWEAAWTLCTDALPFSLFMFRSSDQTVVMMWLNYTCEVFLQTHKASAEQCPHQFDTYSFSFSLENIMHRTVELKNYISFTWPKELSWHFMADTQQLVDYKTFLLGLKSLCSMQASLYKNNCDRRLPFLNPKKEEDRSSRVIIKSFLTFIWCKKPLMFGLTRSSSEWLQHWTSQSALTFFYIRRKCVGKTLKKGYKWLLKLLLNPGVELSGTFWSGRGSKLLVFLKVALGCVFLFVQTVFPFAVICWPVIHLLHFKVCTHALVNLLWFSRVFVFKGQFALDVLSQLISY